MRRQNVNGCNEINLIKSMAYLESHNMGKTIERARGAKTDAGITPAHGDSRDPPHYIRA